MKAPPDNPVIEALHPRIWLHDLREMLLWYEQNICEAEFRDLRGQQVKFTIERFPHLIKLLQKDSTLEVTNPQKHVRAIKDGMKNIRDYGGYQPYRFQRFTSLHAIISRPTKIFELIAQRLAGRVGNTIYVKQFANTHRTCRFEILVCRRVGVALLEVVTCHPQEHGNYSQRQYKQVYP